MPVSTFLVDPTNPNEQVIPEQQPIIWTSGRIYEFFTEANISANKAAWYKSLDGGITWTQPDIAHASVCHGFSDWMQVSNLAYMLIIANSSGAQNPRLQTFDLNAETYSSVFSTTGPPSETFIGPVRIAVMSNGKIIIVYATPTVMTNSRCKFAIYDPGSNTWPVGTTDIATNIGGNFSQWETIIPDPANNLIHCYYSDSLTTYCYRRIHSDGTLDTITTFSGGLFNSLHVGNLNTGRAFSTGFLDGTNLVTPCFTRTSGAIFSLNVITGTPSTSATPTFTISADIDTASSIVLGQDIGSMIAYNNGGTYSVLYFIGDGTNLYNLVKLATFNGTSWSTVTLYDATTDPNAGKNTSNNQWLNAISGGPNGSGSFVFQVATWLQLPGQSFQNTSMLTTLVGAAAPTPVIVSPSTGGGWFFGQKGLILMRIVLPDPKLCKTPAQLNEKQFQKGFTICE